MGVQMLTGLVKQFRVGALVPFPRIDAAPIGRLGAGLAPGRRLRRSRQVFANGI